MTGITSHRRRRLLALLALAVLALGVLAACGGGDEATPAEPAPAPAEPAPAEPAEPAPAPSDGEKIVIRVSSEAPIEVDPLPTAVKWKELVEAATNGRVEVQIFPAAQLFDDTAALDAVASGQLEIVLPTTSRLTGFVKDFAVLDLPFVFTTDDLFRAKLDGEMGAALNAKLNEKGMAVLGYWSGGAITFLNKGGELKTPAEWKGKKIRIFGGAVYEETLNGVGATAITIPASETPTAVQQGTADSAVTNWDGWEEVFLDLFDYGMDPGAWRLAFGVVVNKQWWDGLPADVRATLEQTMKEATDFDWSDHKRLETEAIDNIRAAGKTPYEITDADRQAWVEATQPVRDKFAKEIDPAIYALATAG